MLIVLLVVVVIGFIIESIISIVTFMRIDDLAKEFEEKVCEKLEGISKKLREEIRKELFEFMEKGYFEKD